MIEKVRKHLSTQLVITAKLVNYLYQYIYGRLLKNLKPKHVTDSMVLRQVVFGLPLGLFPAGVHPRAIFGIDDLSILKACQSHWSRFCRIFHFLMIQRQTTYDVGA